MQKPRPYTPGLLRSAVRHLRRSDPVIGAVLSRFGPHRFELRTEGTHFDAIARAIVSQQLSVKAAATITEDSERCTRRLEGRPGQ